MSTKMMKKLFALLLIFIALLSLFSYNDVIANSVSYNRSESYYPSYLLLGNWVNTSILITTGVPIPNNTLNGFSNSNTTISNIFVGNYGILPYNISFSIFPAFYAALNLNNTISIKGQNGEIEIISPPKLSSILILISTNKTLSSYISIPSNYSINITGDEVIINATPIIFIYFNGTYKIINSTNKKILEISYYKNGYIEFSIGAQFVNPNNMLKLNDNEVSNWLYKSNRIKNELISNQLASDYYLLLLLLKDNQNPITGEFAASSSPIYLYNWLRDSSFAALALQESGHFNSAYKFWIWEANIMQSVNGSLYTRYNFYTGTPDKSFGIPEFDSIGLFQIGVYEYFETTHNVSFLTSVLPALNKTITFEMNEIKNNEFHLMPEDLSVWETNMGYNFWTQSIDDIGLYDSSLIYQYLGINNSLIKYYTSILNESIIKYFWNGNYFYPTLVQSVNYQNNSKQLVLIPAYSKYDSSTILPIDLGFISPDSYMAYSNAEQEISHLEVLGGLSRFTADNYHYSEYLYDSSAPNPPWDITTLFLAYYYILINNISGSINLLNWAYSHSQNGLLPEAVDPKYGNPLPTTSPLTWSVAMYVITILNLPASNSSKFSTILTWVIIIVFLIVLSYIMEKRKILRL